MAIRLNAAPHLAFLGPEYLDLTRPPAGGGLYAILQPEPGSLDEFRVLYIGKTINFRERGFPRGHEHYRAWVRSTRPGWSEYLRIAYLRMQSEREMLELEAQLIRRVSPPCNDQHRPRFAHRLAAALAETSLQRGGSPAPQYGPRPLPPGSLRRLLRDGPP